MSDKDSVVHLNFYDLLILLAKWRKVFIVNFVIAAIVSSIIALVLPVWYKSSTIILPPSGGGGGLPSFLSKDLAGVAMNFGLEMPTEDIYQSILGSRTLKEKLIQQFDLAKVYKFKDDYRFEDLLFAFDGHYEVNTREDMAIEVIFEDKNAQRSADVANAAIATLDSIYRDITTKSAHNNRIFIEKRLIQINDTLAFYQDSLAKFQLENKTVSIPEQMSALITTAADIKAEQIAKDIELNVLKSSLGNQHSEVIRLQQSTKELSKRYQTIINGEEGDLFIGLSQLPTLSRTFGELYRQIRIQTTLLEFVYPQYENARIQEERESANIQILDPARVPQKKARPSRKLIVLISIASAMLLTLVYVMLYEYWHRLPSNNASDWKKINDIRQMISGRRN